MFYRVVDGYDCNDREVRELRDIERRVFRVVKGEEFGGSWDGSLTSNQKADELVAVYIRTSFQVYERSGKQKSLEDKTYFQF